MHRHDAICPGRKQHLLLPAPLCALPDPTASPALRLALPSQSTPQHGGARHATPPAMEARHATPPAVGARRLPLAIYSAAETNTVTVTPRGRRRGRRR